jgi:hypothetical protein
LNERQQIVVDQLFVGGAHAVRQAGINLQRLRERFDAVGLGLFAPSPVVMVFIARLLAAVAERKSSARTVRSAT